MSFTVLVITVENVMMRLRVQIVRKRKKIN